MFNNKLKGKPLEIINQPIEDYIQQEMNYSINVIKPIIEQLKRVINM